MADDTQRAEDVQEGRHKPVPEWALHLGITDRTTGIVKAAAAREAVLAAGRKVLGRDERDFTIEMVVFWGLLARAQGLHEGVVAGIRADNPYATFPLLRAYAENAAAVLYVTDKPEEMDKLWNDRRGQGIWIGHINRYAKTRFGAFKNVYDELSKYAHPATLSLLNSMSATGERTLRWQSSPTFGSEADAVMACAWCVELAVATSHLLVEFADSRCIAAPASADAGADAPQAAGDSDS
jgi:hypothetical protein